MAKSNSICSIPDCGKLSFLKGFCRSHYKRVKKYGDPLAGGPPRERGTGCKVEGCNRPFSSKWYCELHYKRWKLYGAPGEVEARITKAGDPLAYYQNIVLKYEGDECIPWPYGKSGNGYGRLKKDGTVGDTHRFVCEDVNGPPPSPYHEAAHSCGNGHLACVTKGHLSWKTGSENQADRVPHNTHKRGERSHFAVLTETQVREIISLKGKETHASIAKRYGISRPHVSQIQSGKSWTWLTQ